MQGMADGRTSAQIAADMGVCEETLRRHLRRKGHDSYVIGKIVKGNRRVVYSGKLIW